MLGLKQKQNQTREENHALKVPLDLFVLAWHLFRLILEHSKQCIRCAHG